MDNKDIFTVKDLFKEQVQISIFTVILNFVFVIFILLFKLDKSLILGVLSGEIVALALHWLLFRDLKIAIRMEKDDAVNYANLHSFLRKMLLIIAVVFLLANKWIKINAIGLIVGLLSLRFVLYFYNLIKLKNK